MARTDSCVHHIKGDIFDRQYRRSSVCICQQCNCVTMIPHGLSYDIVREFGSYANSYGRRKPLTRNIATIKTRGTPGTVDFCEGKPCIANLFGQFMFGKSTGSQMIPKQYEDDHMKQEKIKDTKANRLLYFEACLEELLKFLDTTYTEINMVVFPYRIGCGMAGGNWFSYLNLIKKFAKELQAIRDNNIKVIVVQKEK
uniref:Wsv206-like protein n=1 Tax=Penaeus monodon endogenous nimavirus TaxID=2133795 RepID=A0A401IPN6_9VIRU|nr:MAG: wsv206-like protein [Penaeus monodon endogenous nimavirus]GBG35560.1 wsv206-like protein [Penaeus monodon endogenous nimavirus]